MEKLIDITGKAIAGEWGNDDDAGTGIPVLRTTNFTNDGVINYNNVVTRDIQKKDLSQKFLQPGDIIIEKSGGSDKQPVGRVVYYDGEPGKFLFNNFTGVLRVRDKSVWYPRYVFYALYGNYAKGGTRRYENKTTGLHNLKTDQYVQDFAIQEQPLEYQQQIVSRLDKVTELIALRKEQLAKLDQLVKSRFIELFGDPKLNNKAWKMNTFADMCTVRQGLQIPISKRLTICEENCYEYITVAYLHGAKEREYIKNPKSTVICRKEDILMTRTGNTGMVVTNVAGVFHNNFFLVDFDRKRYNKCFLVEYLNLDLIQAEIKRRAGTSTIPDLNHGEFYAISIYEPPITLQEQFAAFIDQTDKSKLAIQQSLEKLELLKKSLMQEYFG